VLGAIALLAFVVLVWQLRSVVLLAFAGILFGIVFDSGARLIERWLPIGHVLSLALATIVIVGLAGLAMAIFGREVVHQVTDLIARLPAAWASARGERWHPRSRAGGPGKPRPRDARRRDRACRLAVPDTAA
jgi:predicted PurR-regulated permease PerM